MSEHASNIEVERGSPRGFGVVFSIVFALLGLWPLISSRSPNLILLSLAVITLAVAIVAPGVLEKPNRLWFRFGILLGAFIAPIIMALVFLIAIVPTGIIMRLVGKDLLNQKLEKSKDSYWIERTEDVHSMKNQF